MKIVERERGSVGKACGGWTVEGHKIIGRHVDDTGRLARYLGMVGNRGKWLKQRKEVSGRCSESGPLRVRGARCVGGHTIASGGGRRPRSLKTFAQGVSGGAYADVIPH